MDKDDIWRSTLAMLLNNIEENDPKTVFLKMISPVGIFGDQFILLAESEAVESWVRSNYLDEIQQIVDLIGESPLTVGLAANTSPKETSQQPPKQHPQTIKIAQTSSIDTNPNQEPEWLNHYVDPTTLKNQSNASSRNGIDNLKPMEKNYINSPTAGNEALFSKCTFDTFVVGKSNEFARGAALAVAEQPGIAYNPLFIYGDSGLGKTHLLVAIANYVMQNFPRMTTQYVKAPDFLRDYVEATQKNQWASFNNKYHQVDILLVDDVQILEGKDETINQLFNIFNEMTNGNKQIVLSADRSPKDIDMDDRMRSRFISGLLADIKPPDYETRLAILKNYLSRVNQNTSFYGNVPDEVLSYLAEALTPNIREMEGSITRLVSNMTLSKKDTISVEEAKELLQDFFPTIEDKKVDIPLIQSEVEKFFNITHDDIISEKRTKNILMPRQIAMYLARLLTEESLESIGKKFGGRDHSTVLNSIYKIEKNMKENRHLFDQVEQLTIIINRRG